MRTLISLLLLLTLNAFGAPQPTTYLNAWTTNRSVLPVFGDNNLSVSNRIAGAGGGTSWNFYGISPNTVARLRDATNIANAIVTNAIASSNANYVLKYFGTASDLTTTNLTNYDAFVSIDDAFGMALTFYDSGLDISSDDSLGGTPALTIQNLTVLFADTNNQRLAYASGGGPSTGYTNLQFGLLTPFNWDTFIGGYPDSLSMTWGKPQNTWSNIYGFNFYGTNFHPQMATASRLAALDSKTNLTNSAYSDADIAALQAAVGNTNLYVEKNAGRGTNNTFVTPTNTVSTSNQNGLTIVGLVGQTAPYISVLSNGTAQVFTVDRSGNVIISNSLPSLILSNNAHKFSLDTSDGFTLNFKQDGSSQATLNNSGLFNATMVSFAGGQAIYKSGTGTNGFSSGTGSTPTGNIIASNILAFGRHAQITNTSFISPISGQVLFCTSNYDVYVITPTKTNLFAVGQ